MWTIAAQNSDELIYIWSLYTCSDCRSISEVFQDIFAGLQRTLSFNFQEQCDFSRAFQVPEFARKNPELSGTSQEAWEPWRKIVSK